MKKDKFSINCISKKDKIILVATILILAVFIYSKFLLIPELISLQKNIDLYKKVNNQCKKIELYGMENKTLKEKLNGIEKEYEERNSELPKTPNIAKVIRDLKILSDKNEVEIEDLNDINRNLESANEEVNEENTNNNLKENSIDEEKLNNSEIKSEKLNLRIVGLYENLTSFIKEIENYNRITEVNNINFTKNNEELVCTFDVKFYYLESNEGEKYDFNTRNYGKKDLFN